MSASAKDLIFVALDHAVQNAEISEDGFTPFSMRAMANGQRHLTRFVAGEDLADGVQAGREALGTAPDGTSAVTLAWDGYLTLDGQRTEAVFVEAHEVGLDKSVLIGQRYTRVDGKVQALGNPMLRAETEPLIRMISDTP